MSRGYYYGQKVPISSAEDKVWLTHLPVMIHFCLEGLVWNAPGALKTSRELASHDTRSLNRIPDL